MSDEHCPFCTAPTTAGAEACSSCGRSFPWVKAEVRLTNLVKEREVSRVRATLTLLEDLNSWAARKKPFPIAAVKGLAFSLLLPSAIIVVGSLLGAAALGVQTYLLFKQLQLQEVQNQILARQSALEVFEKTARFKEMLASALVDESCKTMPTGTSVGRLPAWSRSSQASVRQIAQLASADLAAVVPVVETLLVDDSGAVAAGALSVLQELRRLGLYSPVDRFARFRGATMADSQLQGFRFPLTDFSHADLASASLRNGTFGGSNFRSANLTGAHLSDTSLIDADFTCSSLESADLSGADLARASFDRANLRGANFKDVKNWKLIDGMSAANLAEIRNAPDGFVEWATLRGARTAAPVPSQKANPCETRKSCE
jgi:uncharacterized protein YjbI with pentapeptide repeats